MNKMLTVYKLWFSSGHVGQVCIILLLCCFALMLPQRQAGAAGIEVMSPSPGATISARNAETHLVLRQAGLGRRGRDVRIKTVDAMLRPVVAVAGDGYFYWHFRLPLVDGENSFSIEPDGQKVELKFKSVQTDLGSRKALNKETGLFHLSENLPESCQDCHDLRETKKLAPIGLTKDASCIDCHRNLIEKGSWRHSTTQNQQCLACHQQSVEPWRIGFPAASIRDFCFNCHIGKKSWLNSQFKHGPLSIGGCTLCHNPHGDKHRYQLFSEGSLELCIDCHGEMKNLVTKKISERRKYVHGVVLGVGCTACHDPHASDQPFVLKKPINELCSGCHPQVVLKRGGHPVPNHPVSAPSERLRPGRKLSCTSCHDPHGSDNRLMLIQTPLGGRLCRECHAR